MHIMKVLIVYHSEHHDNTKKLVDAIAGQGDVTLLNASENSNLNWSDYDLIGFASGIYYQKFHKDILDSAEKNLPSSQAFLKSFLLCLPQGVQGYWGSFRDKTRQPQKCPSSPYLTFPVRGGIFERQSEIVIQLADY